MPKEIACCGGNGAARNGSKDVVEFTAGENYDGRFLLFVIPLHVALGI